ncbi:MAG: hypothetical protein KAT65_22045, partial [Methanophagales archaeon]|nr:hypothetical protein [Methanophagales archaeon]
CISLHYTPPAPRSTMLFRSTICSAAPTPLPQLRKINCTLQNAPAEKKAAWWAASDVPRWLCI